MKKKKEFKVIVKLNNLQQLAQVVNMKIESENKDIVKK